MREGSDHPDRNARFEYINRQVLLFGRRGWPILSVDTRKKELLGDFGNPGQECQPAGCPEPVRAHDLVDPRLGKAIPNGVYDVTRNRGWVSVEIDHDTAEFAVEALRRWRKQEAAKAFPDAQGVWLPSLRKSRFQSRMPRTSGDSASPGYTLMPRVHTTYSVATFTGEGPTDTSGRRTKSRPHLVNPFCLPVPILHWRQ